MAESGLGTLDNKIQFTTSPDGAAVTMCDPDSEKDVIALTLGRFAADAGDNDTWRLTNGAGNIGDVTISIEACGDMSGFNDEMVTFSFVGMSLMGTPAGMATSPPVLIWWSRCGA